MSESYLSEIRLFSFAVVPKGWAPCEGQLLPINQNQALFSLLGTTFGGDGRATFALPDLRGRVPIHFDAREPIGRSGGEATHTLTVSELPGHDHVLQASDAPGTSVGEPGVLLANAGSDLYGPPAGLAAMNAEAVTTVGGGQPHPNMQPYLTLSFCISLTGELPPRP